MSLSYFLSRFPGSLLSSNTVSVREFSNTEWGSERRFKQLQKSGSFDLGNVNARLDAGQVGAIVRECLHDRDNGVLADKVLDRLEANEKWRTNRVDLGVLESAVKQAESVLEFGRQSADPVQAWLLFYALGTGDKYLEKLEKHETAGTLTHEMVAEILADWVAEKYGKRAAQLLKRNAFDQAFSRKVPLYGYKTEESRKDFVSWIQNNIEVANKHARLAPKDTLSAQVDENEAQIRISRSEMGWSVFTSIWSQFEETDNFEERISKLKVLMTSTNLRKGCGELRQIAIFVKNMLAAAKDFNELAVLQSRLLREKVDLVLQRSPDQPSLETLIAEQRIRLSDSTKVAAGLNEWVNQAPFEPEKAARQGVADQILASLKKPDEKTLRLDVRTVTTLPAEIGALSHLERLKLDEGWLQSLPDSIGLLSNLQGLFLGGNQLRSLPDSIGGLRKLQRLYLSNNLLLRIPDSIGDLMNLQNLFLGKNQLESLPDSIGGLRKLQRLYLCGNQLQSLPESIGGLSNLQVLNLYNNKLQSLPDSIGGLRKLQWLYLSNNLLQSLPNWISRLNLSEDSRREIAQIKAKLGLIGAAQKGTG